MFETSLKAPELSSDVQSKVYGGERWLLGVRFEVRAYIFSRCVIVICGESGVNGAEQHARVVCLSHGSRKGRVLTNVRSAPY